MTVTAAQILTAETVPQYLQDRWESEGIGNTLGATGSVEESLEGVEVQAIQGGNVNYAFCIRLPSIDKVVFLKQAPEFVAVFGPDGFPLTSERMQREMDVYSEWKGLLGDDLGKKYLPEIYYFDKKSMVVIMEFFDGFDLLDHMLVDDKKAEALEHDSIGSALGDFMGRVHAASHSSKVDADRVKYLTEHFENREMRDIQLEFVFTKCYKEATDEQRAGLTLTDEFLKEVELLKSQYDGKVGDDALVLTHGDLHPGSVMVSEGGEVKVIDPEFTVYGPAGLDVGSLLSGYCLGAIHQAFCDNPTLVARIVAGAEAIWNAYAAALKEGGMDDAQIKAIEIETVGFTVSEVCRTALEFAGGRKWLQFDDAALRQRSKKVALKVVDNCMIARHTGGIALLFSEMKAVSAEE
mmetsp:Transcript_22911/g.50905  ORF Transcript_22911/g.50905 Transcript_22911/m.50905 type:complete len:408 (+) Transcript_22911:143-1366(+)